jgi:type II secretory pathway component PulK
MLGSPDDNLSRRAENAFRTVFQDAGLDEDLWRTMKDFVSDSGKATSTPYVEGVIFNRGGSSYTAKRGIIGALAELRIIPGLRHDYRQLAGYICAGEREGKININFASEKTINAFLPELASYASQIVELRENTPFKTKDELYTMLGSSSREDYIAALPYFDVKSTLFYVRIEIDLMQTVQHYHALFRRSGRRLTLVSYIEGGNMDYY